MIVSITGASLLANGFAMCLGGLLYRRSRRVRCRVLYRRSGSDPGGELIRRRRQFSRAIIDWEPTLASAYRASYLALGLVVVGGTFRFPIMLAGGGVLISFWMIPSFHDGFQTMVSKRRLTGGGLMGLSTLAFVLTRQSLFAASGFNLFQVGRQLSRMARRQSRCFLAEALAGRGAKAWVLCDGVEIAIPFRDLRDEDLIVVKNGSFVPVDALVIDGQAQINQHLLSPVRGDVSVTVGDTVYASSYVTSGSLVIRKVLLGPGR